MKAKVTLELEIDLSDEALIYSKDDPSPPGVGLPKGAYYYVELAPDCPEPGIKIFEDLYELVFEHAAFDQGDSVFEIESRDPEAFLQDLFKRFGLRIELEP